MSFDLAIINGDLKILSSGQYQTVTDTPKLIQDIVKVVLTPLGSDVFNPWYGCAINQRTMGRNLPEQLLLLEIQTSIMESIDNIKQIQQSQLSVQQLTLAEQIQKVKSISATYDPTDHRQINVAIQIVAKDLSQMEEVFIMKS